MLYEGFGERTVSIINYIVDGAEMIGGLDNVVYVDGLGSYPDGIGLKYIACLVVGQTATLYMIGVVGEVDLDTVIDATFEL